MGRADPSLIRSCSIFLPRSSGMPARGSTGNPTSRCWSMMSWIFWRRRRVSPQSFSAGSSACGSLTASEGDDVVTWDFEAYMQRVTSIEQRALEFELSATLDLKQLLALQVELSGLKNEALRRFTIGEIEGEELISGFITQVNDARGYLTRLILHERDNIEHKAETEHALDRGSLGREGRRPGPRPVTGFGED